MNARINSSRSLRERGVDAYFTPPAATRALLRIERVPHYVSDPACGNGAILRECVEAGRECRASDIRDYGYPGAIQQDYLKSCGLNREWAIVTNPPYVDAFAFAMKAIHESEYVAFLLRLNFLESVRRKPFFEKHPPARVLVSSRRLPMMHRFGYGGVKNGSNCCYAWFVWDARDSHAATSLAWFDWKPDLQLQVTFKENL